ncbi:MarR family winged helix-turn-helix transcriptional regulator [Chengkuizengella sediminis]|uniref:MarR family winged helix-turn-helix transcriptional regulator n=1 Tax=Chengkuizengella sediminis TaxID=1885917 RepID=UPI0013893E8A|nr:MarR family transcriptional regulator [Chengkuizengella sediminis]NDI33955.1 MarR family transcriptional regulator [Chengkuizengella sediminis]
MYRGDEQSELDLRLFRIWMKANKSVSDNVSKDIKESGVAPDHFMILELLYNKGPHPIQRISEIFSIPSGSITYVVDKLEQKEFVKRQACPTDRRASNVVLTEKGELLFNKIFPKHVETISSNLSFISNEEKETLIDLLKKIGMGSAGLK